MQESLTLAEKFPALKALTIDLGYFNALGTSKNSQIRFTPNLDTGKSVVRIDCPNRGCIRGDFDLTDELASAIATQQPSVAGEICCRGWQSKTTIDTVPCHNILRYTLNLTY